MTIAIELEYTDRVNFAMQQNGVPLVDALRLTNAGDATLEDLLLRLGLENGECEPWVGRVMRIEPGAVFRLVPEGLTLAARVLATRTEAERTNLMVDVSCAGSSESKRFSVDLLAFDQWPGTGHYPELTAAFVTPNHPMIAELLAGARESLRGRGDSDALDGYQSGSRQRASRIAEACFNALATRDIGYINPPASFDRDGQRVRLVDRLMREQLGTCLDLSLLMAGMWEQCGLHPLILLLEGHAMPAVWTHEAHLPEPAIDEPARVRNLMELGEVVAVEATMLTQRGTTFAAAVDAAKRRMQSPGGSFCGVDIRASRKRGVRPLPLRTDGQQSELDLDEIAQAPAAVAADTTLDPVALAERAESPASSAHAAESQESGSDRIRRWQMRLLDLSLRNRLINFRETGRTIGLHVPVLARLEDVLASECEVAIRARSDGDEQFLRSELDSLRIYTNQPPAETQKRLLNLYRTARSSIEETGANLLHVALGMLQWYENDSAETPRFAPLILLPATLRRSATGAGYAYGLSLSDEPLRPNVTLLEKLRADFGIDTTGLDDLPEDENGLDVPLILRRFREAIRDSARWEVIETAHLGLFSFNKFLMWRDLQDNLPRVKQSRLVSHLVERPGGDFDSEPFPQPETLDDTARPEDLLCTRDADSSQLAAVRALADGRTFVLEGPPGTGKSQTIANMIADSLARGKRVLFVAEKMAALSVVRSRLEADGLGPFCLELHSAKASKKEVLAQLERAMTSHVAAEPSIWGEHCSQLDTARDHLNAYVRALHTGRGTGENLYQVLGRLTLLGEGPRVSPPISDIARTTHDQLQAWRREIVNLSDKSGPIDPPHEHPLRELGCSEWSFSLPTQAKAVVAEAIEARQKLSEALGAVLSKSDLPHRADDLSLACVDAIVAVAELLPSAPAPDSQFLIGTLAPSLREAWRDAVALGRRRDELRADLLTRYRDEFLELEHLRLIDDVQRASQHPWPIRFFTGHAARRKLRAYAKGSVPALARLLSDLESARQVKRLSADLAGKHELSNLLGTRWKAGEADWDELARQLDWCEQFAGHSAPLARSSDSAAIAQRLAELVSNPAGTAQLNPPAAALVSARSQWDHTRARVQERLRATSDASPDASTANWLESMHAMLRRWQDGLGELNDWCAWRGARDSAIQAGLQDLVTTYERGEIHRADLSDVFERSFGEQWFNAVANSVEAIRGFNAHAHNGLVTRFRSLDNAAVHMSRLVVAARLRAAAPIGSAPASSHSEIGILRRELAKKRRHLPTRRLIEAMPNLLPRLKPCLLMSPLSVAQFLDTGLPPFDLVVFDEASQIPVWDAVGAIARGQSIVVVGDSKQLPPTNFFNALDGDDEAELEDVQVEDMESILKECNASGIPAMRLRWHYRSRHESLIAFSNHHYYQNELHTFPSPVERSEALGVTFRHVADGVYDRGGSRTNRVEAEHVVDFVVQRLTRPDADGSIGIVTFNLAQQSLIEDLLDERRRECPQIEPFFTGEAGEGVFVKNLESVQGDERNTIIFSVGYGPDQTGRASMNFGPLNQDGGERRLNVAVTRARRRLIVFSSLRADQIDLKRSRALGVRHFKAFLDYADRGPLALAEEVSPTHTDAFDSGFEAAVCGALRQRGWEIDTQVGCAGYRIDLGVRDPDCAGRYLLGIECDGAAYHSAKTARDRDRLRQSVLEGLGWTLARVWSTDWRVNPDRCLAHLEQAIQRAPRSTPAAHSPDTSAPMTEHQAWSPDDALGTMGVPPDSRRSDGAPTPSEGDAEPSRYAAAPTLGAESPAEVPSARVLRPYKTAPLPRRLSQLDVYDSSTRSSAIRALCEIVRVEGPIVDELALRRLAKCFGVQRVTSRFRDHYGTIRDAARSSGAVGFAEGALWPGEADPERYTDFRVPSDDPESGRELELVPLVERTNAVVRVLEEQIGLPREELAREVARVFGCTRLTPRSTAEIDEAIDRAIALGRAQQSGDNVALAR